jgi:hypothetical protein
MQGKTVYDVTQSISLVLVYDVTRHTSSVEERDVLSCTGLSLWVTVSRLPVVSRLQEVVLSEQVSSSGNFSDTYLGDARLKSRLGNPVSRLRMPRFSRVPPVKFPDCVLNYATTTSLSILSNSLLTAIRTFNAIIWVTGKRKNCPRA